MIISVTSNRKELYSSDCKWFVYILECGDKSLYTGITNDIEKRLKAHNSGKGAKFTKYRCPVVLRYYEKVKDKSSALKREIAIKKLTRQKKLNLIATGQ